MFKKSPLISRVILFVIIPVFTLCIVFYSLGLQTTEITKGKINVVDLEQAVDITFDELGVPFVTASNDLDAVYAVGFLHAQFRLWQMEMDRKIATGRLSEVIGESALSSDKFMRTMSLSRSAENALSKLNQSNRAILKAYTNGVNNGLNSLERLPLEFEHFDFKPEPWTELDSMLKMQLVSLNMALNFSHELRNHFVHNYFDKDVASELLSLDMNNIHQKIGMTISAESVEALFSVLPEKIANPNSSTGSNAWAVSGANTLSGKAILANDPHLDNTLPSAFFLVDINSEKLNVTGATFPGLPFVVAGKNEFVSWGITSMEADTQDLFIERLSPYNSNQYLLDGEYVNMEVSQETIDIKSEFLKGKSKKHTFNVRRTHRGPVISDLIPNSNEVFSLRWTGDDEDGGSFSSFLDMNYAKSGKELALSSEGIVAPILNIVYADKEGNIGRIAPGKYPVRSKAFGVLPTPGWESNNDWQGWIEPGEWPRSENPASGMIVVANNKVVGDDYQHYISSDWSPKYRADRISQLLREKSKQTNGKLTKLDMRSIQMDQLHPMSEIIQSFFSRYSLLENSPLSDSLLTSLKRWNGVMSEDSFQAAFVAVFLSHLNEQIFIDEVKNSGMPKGIFKGIYQQLQYPILAQVLSNKPPLLCDYNDGIEHYDCNELIDRAIKITIRELERKLGDDFAQWRWSDLATTHYYHFPFSGSKFINLSDSANNKILAALYHRKYAGESTGEAINTKGMSLDMDKRFYQLYGASFRQIVDFGVDNQSSFILSTGQSGNIFSEHYADMLEPFRQGRYFDIGATVKRKKMTLAPLNREK